MRMVLAILGVRNMAYKPLNYVCNHLTHPPIPCVSTMQTSPFKELKNRNIGGKCQAGVEEYYEYIQQEAMENFVFPDNL